MMKIEDWQARLILRIMNTAAEHYSDVVRQSAVMDDIEFLREKLEGEVGSVKVNLQDHVEGRR